LQVLLRALREKMLTFALRVFVRLELFVNTLLEVSSDAQQQPAAAASGAMATGAQTPAPTNASSNTPVKGRSGDMSMSTAVAAMSAQAIVSVEEYVCLAEDLHRLGVWITDTFAQFAVSAVCLSAAATAAGSELVVKCMNIQTEKLRGAKAAVWTKLCGVIVQDCVRGLASVKSVAAKFRMTNKPAPDMPSAYVETTLQPFKYAVCSNAFLLLWFRNECWFWLVCADHS
jgi:hypothetical protein